MPSEAELWLAVALVAGLLYSTRVAGALIMARVTVSPLIERFLDGLSVSVIAAIVASGLAQSGLREATAVALACAVALATRSAIWAMLAGILLAAAWSAIAS